METYKQYQKDKKRWNFILEIKGNFKFAQV